MSGSLEEYQELAVNVNGRFALSRACLEIDRLRAQLAEAGAWASLAAWRATNPMRFFDVGFPDRDDFVAGSAFFVALRQVAVGHLLIFPGPPPCEPEAVGPTLLYLGTNATLPECAVAGLARWAELYPEKESDK